MPGATRTVGGRALPGLADADGLADGEELDDGDGLADGLGERLGDGVALGVGVALAEGDGLAAAAAYGCSVDVNRAGQAGGTPAANTALTTTSMLSKPMTVGAAAKPGRPQCLPFAWLSAGATRTRISRVLPVPLPRCRAFNISAVE